MLRDFKRIMVYRNDFGGKIIVKITLPKTECESDINRLYDSISFSYFDSARDFIAKTGDSSVYTLSVEWQAKEKNKTTKRKLLIQSQQNTYGYFLCCHRSEI